MIERPAVEKIFVALAADEKFLQHAATTICSVLQNTTSSVHFFVLHNGIDEGSLDQLADFVLPYHSSLQAIKVQNVPDGLKVHGHASIANYFRLLLPICLPDEIEKVLYLDSDVLVRKDIVPLFSIDLENCAVAAVEDMEWLPAWLDRLDIPRNHKYFNSGVLLINLKEWRMRQVHAMVIRFIQEHPEKIVFWDQDGLNAVLHDEWKELPYAWNVQNGFFSKELLTIRHADVVEDPYIVHFTGDTSKPWINDFRHPFSADYFNYRSQTPWPFHSASPENSGRRNWLRKKIVRMVKQIVLNASRFAPVHKLMRKANEISTWILQDVRSRNERSKISLNPIQDTSFSNDNLATGEKPISLSIGTRVLSGPFAGLQYPEQKSYGSTLSPKIIGSYEAELHAVINEVLNDTYRTIIDIGCAEGYYAVGFAYRLPDVTVWAYDVDPHARAACENLARWNRTSERVHVRKTFTMRSLSDLTEGDGFILCDCEGAEEFIFYKEPNTWELLTKRYDLLIEIHDFVRPGISAYLYDLFCDDYEITRIFSTNDPLRPHLFGNFLPGDISPEEKKELLAEKRPGIMEWFYLKRKCSPK